MKRALLVVFVCGQATLAAAQPAPAPVPDGAPVPSGVPATDPSAPPLAPTLSGPPPSQFGPLVTPLVPTRDPWAAHHGITVEAALGFGVEHIGAYGTEPATQSNAGLAGLDLAVGGWLTRQLALTFRISGVSAVFPDVSSNNVVTGFYGAALQYWPAPHAWLGAGIGYGRLDYGTTNCDESGGSCSYGGLALDLRAGFVLLQRDRHTVNASVEINTASVSNDSDSWTATSYSIVLGYQFL